MSGEGRAGGAPLDYLPSAATGACGLAVFVAGLISLRVWPRLSEVFSAPLVLVGAMAGVMLIYELAVTRITRRAATTGVDWRRPAARCWPRIMTKLLGLAGCVGLVGLLYFVFPEYHGSFYAPYYGALRQLWLPATIAAVVYVALIDGRMVEPEDGYWHLGRLLLLRPGTRPDGTLLRLIMGWLIKGFYLPLMYIWYRNNIYHYLGMDLRPATFVELWTVAQHLLYTLDLSFACVGYALTLRLVDSHIRSPQPTALGWVSTLICYQPFWSLIYGQYLNYSDEHTWATITAPWPALQVALGVSITAATAVYAWATVAFGLRFSNLTHRGIIRHGPYRWLKHPAYVSKNLSYWLIELPFLRCTWAQGARACGRLLLVNLIYVVRAITEERHLGEDPTYRDYRRLVDRRGLWARLRPGSRPDDPQESPGG